MRISRRGLLRFPISGFKINVVSRAGASAPARLVRMCGAGAPPRFPTCDLLVPGRSKPALQETLLANSLILDFCKKHLRDSQLFFLQFSDFGGSHRMPSCKSRNSSDLQEICQHAAETRAANSAAPDAGTQATAMLRMPPRLMSRSTPRMPSALDPQMLPTF